MHLINNQHQLFMNLFMTYRVPVTIGEASHWSNHWVFVLHCEFSSQLTFQVVNKLQIQQSQQLDFYISLYEISENILYYYSAHLQLMGIDVCLLLCGKIIIKFKIVYSY